MLVTLLCCILTRPKAKVFANISAELPGQEHKDEIVIIGAHYHTHKASPGAHDNGSAVAALLELARHFVRQQTARTLRFVASTNEESPFRRRKAMGNRVYAGECRRRRDNIIGMICLETIGCYSEEIGSQWREGFPALMAIDTAPPRYPYYLSQTQLLRGIAIAQEGRPGEVVPQSGNGESGERH